MSDLEVLERLVPVGGRDVVDVGCGGGALVRSLAARGARVTGVEISESQLAAAVRDDNGSGARYVVGVAQRLPIPDESIDVVLFMRSLHHVPPDDMLEALHGAARVLRPGGAVYIAEPLTEGDFFELTSLVEDEREVRASNSSPRAGRAVLPGADAGRRAAPPGRYGVRPWGNSSVRDSGPSSVTIQRSSTRTPPIDLTTVPGSTAITSPAISGSWPVRPRAGASWI